MNMTLSPASPGIREDILVSICFVESSPRAARDPALAALAKRLAERFQYWEILVVASADDAVAAAVPNVPNLRLIKVTPQANHYRRREIAASEAIGDVVVLSAFDELDAADPVAMAEAAWNGGVAVVATRVGQVDMLEPFLIALGRGGGFRVSSRSMQSMALPRPLLTLVMGYPDRQLALRFLPRDAGVPVRMLKCTDVRKRRGLRDWSRRLALLHSLLSHSAGSVLTAVAVFAALAAIGAVLFILYVLVVWATRDELAEGWLTLSASIGGSTLFLGVAIFGIAIGLRRVIDLLSVHQRDDVVGEVSALNLFAELSRKLNVTVEEGAEAIDGPPPSAAGTRPPR